MKNGWQTKRLGDVVTRLTNGYVGPTRNIYQDSGVPYLLARHVRNNNLLFDGRTFITNEFNLKNKKSMLKAGDVLLVQSGHIGHSAVVTEEHEGHNCHAMIVISPVKDAVTGPFLSLFFNSPDMQRGFEGIRSGSTVPHLTCGAVKELQIPVPPLAEQQRIVGFFDEAFAGLATAKANAEKNLQNARALFESHLQSVLRSKKWRWKTLGDLCNGVEYGSSAKSKKEGKVPVLRMGNIQDGRLDWDNLAYTDDKEEIAKYLLKHNDVLFNRTNSPELVGKTAIYKCEMPAIFAGYLIRIHRKEDLLDADFLNYFLNSPIAFDYGKTVVISSVNQANINGAKLRGYPIPAPSISEQRAIVKKLDDLREETQRLASLYERKLAALESLRKSLLHHAFTGQLQ